MQYVKKHHSVRKTFSGVSLVDGVGVGYAFHYKDVLSRETETWEIREEEVGRESGRILKVIEKVRKELEELDVSDLGLEEERDIFITHRTLLEDPWLFSLIESELENRKLNGESIIRLVFSFLGQQFKSSPNPLVSQKVFDLEDIEHRILRSMTGAGDNPLGQLGENRVIFARRLLPSDTLHFSRKKPAALVTKEGGPGCHAALIARSLGIPFISDVDVSETEISDGTEVIVDTAKGIIIANPNEIEKRSVLKQSCTAQKVERVLLRHSRDHSRYLDSRGHVSVMANVNVEEDVQAAVDHNCDGVGLYRTENIYMLSSDLPDEGFLFEELYRSLKPLDEKPAVLRLADIGADKTLPYLNVGSEHSSQLGVRGVRFLLRYREFLRLQLRVFCLLSKIYMIKILVPFVSNADDLIEVKKELDETSRFLGLKRGEQPSVGAMIETPLAVMNAESILEHAEFISMGTNDLQQFVAAADRESLMVSQYYKEAGVKIVSMISDIARLSKQTNRDCFVCGEMAGNPEFIPSLLQAGIREFSVLPSQVPFVKETLYGLLAKS